MKPLIVYQQCMDMDNFAWGSMVEKLVWDFAYSHSFVDVPWKDRNYQRLILPFHKDQNYDITDSRRDNVIFCGKTVQTDVRTKGFVGFLGQNDEETVEKWAKYINTVIFNDENDVDRQRRQEIACQAQHLRIAIWQRSDSVQEVSHNRLFRNMEEIRSLVSNYTEVPLRVMTATAEMSPQEQATQFRTFDILITPFGAHLTNMIFGDFRRTVYIQASPVYLGVAYEYNEAFSKRFIGSYGHPTWNNPEVEAMRANCTEGKLRSECTHAFKRTDITADINLLRSALDEAVKTICSEYKNSTSST